MRHHNLQVTGSVSVNGISAATAADLATYTGSNDSKVSTLQSFTASVSTTNTFTASASSRLNSIETISASNVARIGSLETISASNIARLNSLENTSASVDTLNTNQNNRLTSLEIKTGSLATTGSNTFYGTQIISGSTYIAGDFVVQGSSSIQYISASSVSIGTNIVNLNTANPAVRYGGISVQDSGSANGVTGSLLWDSTCNRWMYSNPSTVGYSGGIIMSGPRAATLGTETTLTCNYIAKSGGGDHLYDSCIWEMSGSVGINCATPSYNLDINGCTRISADLTTNGSIAIQKNAATDNRYLQLCDTTTGGYRWDLIVQSTTQGCGFGVFNNTLNDYAVRFTPTNLALFGYGVCAPSMTLNTSSDGYNMLCLVSTGGDAGMYLKGGATNNGGWSIQSRNNCQFAIVDRTAGSNVDRFVLTSSLLKLCQGASGASGYSLTGGLQIESTNVTGINILSPDTGYGRIYFSAPTGGTTTGAVEYIHSSTPASGYMKLRANGTDILYVVGNGYVGINNASPNRHLSIKGSNEAWNENITTATTTQCWLFGQDGARKGFEVYDLNTSSTRLFVAPTNGYVGVGLQCPTYTFHTYCSNYPAYIAVQTGLTGSSSEASFVAKTSDGIGLIALGADVSRGLTDAGRCDWAYSLRTGGCIRFSAQVSAGTTHILLNPSGVTCFASTICVGGRVSAISSGVDGTFADAFVGIYSGNSNEQNAIQTAVSSNADGSGFLFMVSCGAGLSTRSCGYRMVRNRHTFYTDNTPRLNIDSSGVACFSSLICPNGIVNPSTTIVGAPSSTRLYTDLDIFQGYYSTEACPRFSLGRDVFISGGAGLAVGRTGTVAMIGDNGAGTALMFSVGGPISCGTSYLKMCITSSGHITPGANGTQNLGSSSLRWSTVYTSDLDLSNGIGDYTIVEGENDLFLYNNKQCKVYRFMLEQVCAECATPKKI